MAEATGDRATGDGAFVVVRGRESRPHGEGEAVDTACKQEMDDLSDTVNTEFILDMQRKLYRWSAADPDKSVRGSVQYRMRPQNVDFMPGNGWPVTGAAIHRARIA